MKTIRKKLKSSLFYNILQNIFYRPKKTFSECFGEDLFINHYFKDNISGTFIDVGCNQPVINSLTHSLYNKNWQGINIDISKRSIDLHNFLRKKSINYNIAVGERTKEIEAFIFYENCTMNTVNKRFKKYTEVSVSKKPVVNRVKQFTLNQIIEKNNLKKIDFLNIDIEGNEMNVLKGFNITKYKPDLVAVEIHDNNCPAVNNPIYMYFIKNNYFLTSIYGWTYFFEHKKKKSLHFNV